jgi:hypothetical protein
MSFILVVPVRIHSIEAMAQRAMIDAPSPEFSPDRGVAAGCTRFRFAHPASGRLGANAPPGFHLPLWVPPVFASAQRHRS